MLCLVKNKGINKKLTKLPERANLEKYFKVNNIWSRSYVLQKSRYLVEDLGKNTKSAKWLLSHITENLHISCTAIQTQVTLMKVKYFKDEWS